MKRTMTLAIAASMFMLALAAAPQRASAAHNIFINFGDDVGSKQPSSPPPPPSIGGFLTTLVLALLG
jgi:hypothetical protein